MCVFIDWQHMHHSLKLTINANVLETCLYYITVTVLGIIKSFQMSNMTYLGVAHVAGIPEGQGVASLQPTTL